jgi:hypothetical protein
MWRANKKSTIRLSYGELDSAILQRAIRAVTTSGGAIMFGLTSDGGAFSVCVLYKEEKLKDYPNSPEGMEQLLGDLADQFEDWSPAA